MTLNEIKALDREFLVPAEVASILGVDPQAVRVTARECPERLGFKVAVFGTRVKIPRVGFIRWMEGKEAQTWERA